MKNNAGEIVLPALLAGGSIASCSSTYSLPELYSLKLKIEINEEVEITFCPQLLENILLNCSHLNQLMINFYDDEEKKKCYRFKSYSGGKNIKKFDMMSQMDYQEFLASSTVDNLTQCTLSNIPITQRLCNIFNNTLRNLKSLKLSLCNFPEKNKFNNTVLDMRSIHHLEGFSIKTCRSEWRNYASTYFQFEYIDCISNDDQLHT